MLDTRSPSANRAPLARSLARGRLRAMRRFVAFALVSLALFAIGTISLGDPPTPAPAPLPAPPPLPPAPAAPSLPVEGWAQLVESGREVGLPDMEAGRCVAVDLDGDGDADLVVGAGKRVFRNDREGGKLHFTEVSAESGLAPADGKRGADVLAWGDVNGDGFVDCFYGRNRDSAPLGKDGKTREDDGLRSEIRLNDGHGHFTTKAGSGVGDENETTATATFVDVDRDGVLDLYVGNWYVKYGESLECFPSRLYLGRGDGTFRDVTYEAGMLGEAEPGHRNSRRPVYGITHADIDDDGDEDLLVEAYGRQWNVLWRNDGPGLGGVPHFVDVAETTGFDGDDDRSGVYPAEARSNPRLKDLEDEKPFRSNGNTFDAAVGDFDDDGDLDVFTAEITHWWAGPSADLSSLLVNGGRASGFAFTREERGIVRPHEGAHWNQGDLFAGWWDVGNDGALDLFIASGDYPDAQKLRVYRQKPGHTFEDVSAALGIDWTNCGQPTLADFDRDGTADLCVPNSNTRLDAAAQKTRTLRLALYLQRAPKASWIRLSLEGKGQGFANRSAIGARVRVTIGGRVLTREILGCRGHAGHHDEFALTIGLGAADVADSIEVRWPDRASTTQRFEKVDGRRAYRLVQGGTLEADAR
jgi:hypothetical protein